jgi:hypothetical protein
VMRAHYSGPEAGFEEIPFDLLQARLWTSLRNPKDCKREQATKNPDPI